MTLKEYTENLLRLIDNNPEATSYQVITSSDDEGNCFNPVIFEPNIGYYEDNEFNNDSDNNNAVCVN